MKFHKLFDLFGPLKKIGALIVLNGPLLEHDLLDLVWQLSSTKPVFPTICADGGANLLYEISRTTPQSTACTTERVPSHIVGDLDSVDAEVRNYYKDKGSIIVEDKSVNSNDFQKSMQVALSQRKTPSLPIVVIGGHGGRMDQTLGNLNVLYNEAQEAQDVYWISRHNVTLVLGTGTHQVYIDPTKEGPTCGLIPVGLPVRSVTTSGLKWNLDSQSLSFGRNGLISTSNEILEQTVVVETTEPLFWTCELHLSRCK